MNIDSIVDKEYACLSFRALAEAPVSALRGLSPRDARLLAQAFKIYEEDGELVGQQYGTDAGPIDILAVSKDGQRLLVVELKRGRASDVVVGQILRYMGYVKEQIAEPHQTVEGAIIALDDDQKLRWAIAVVPSIRFYRYQVSFKLIRH